MNAVIMAGGEGRRLRPMTCSVPKPLVKLCGRPVCEYILDLLGRHGCENAVFTLRYLGGMIEEYFVEGKFGGISLDFSYEQEPLGTAGCVKKAAKGRKGYESDFLVISGDAMCDFDLSSAMEFHKKRGADATIIAKRVNDPREYGLLLGEDGIVTGFSEKPSFTSCVSDLANTGIYILSPGLLELVPENKEQDFAKDLFPTMLKRGMKLMYYEETGYWCDIGDLSTYKSCQKDMLEGKVLCRLPQNYAVSHKDSGDVEILEPCYIGENVKIGKGSVVEAGSVICEGAFIGRECKIHGAVILEGACLSDGVTCNSCIVGENVSLHRGSSVFENGVCGRDSVIGEGAAVCAGARIWPEKQVPPYTARHEDLKYGSGTGSTLSDFGVEGETNSEISPAFMTKLGSASAGAFSGRALVSCYGGVSAVAMKACFCAGFSAAGGDITDCGAAPLPALIYLSRLMDITGIIYIQSAGNTKVTLLDKGGLPITRVQERKLESALGTGGLSRAPWDGFGSIKTFKNAAIPYAGMVEKTAADISGCRYKIVLKCNNPTIRRIYSPVFGRISGTSGDVLQVRISTDGAKAELYVSEEEKADHAKLITIAAADMMKGGFDAAVPMEFPSALEKLAKANGRTVKRFYRCSNDNSDREARELAASEPFLFDGGLLALTVLRILSGEFVTLGEYLRRLPEYVCENRFIPIEVPPQKILSKLIDKSSGVGEGVVLGDDGGRVLLRSGRRGNGLFLFAESYSAETAKELCDEAEKAVRKIMEKADI